MSQTNNDYNQLDKYEQLAESTLRQNHSRLVHRANRTAGRNRRNRQNRNSPSRDELIGALMDDNDLVEDFVPSYVQNIDPKHFERRWIIQSLSGFYQDKIISDVLFQVKAGKEANVYGCVATPSAGIEMIAAKLYRPRMFRHLRNDAAYKIGRLTHNRDGKRVKRNSGIERATQKKSKFGQDLEFANWIGHEFRMQTKLYEAGADVPKPIAHAGNTILMAFCGDRRAAAGTLNDVTLEPAEAQPFFDQIIENIRLMLALNLVHGDLSPYNILYWQGEITIIDFPQMVDATVNPNAERFLQRDIQRIIDYFTAYGVEADAVGLSIDLWQQFIDGELAI